ncbi:hypothetical protein MMC25_000200 [Agyrium rufum]|nr:hypothetical protein [Agyrium rufum]
MATEQDPLLPRGPTAPEITGPGFRPSTYEYFSTNNTRPTIKREYSASKEQSSQDEPSPLKTILGLFIIVVSFGLILTALVPGGLLSQPTDQTPTKGNFTHPPGTSIDARVEKILSNTPLIDGHNDLAILLRFIYGNGIYDKEFKDLFENGGLYGHVDLPRLKKGMAGGAFWSAYVDCPKNGSDFSDENYAESVATTLSQIDVIKRLTAAYPGSFSDPMANATEVYNSFIASQKLVSPIGIEGLHQIGNSYANLRMYESLGVRYSTLSHNCHNKFVDAALVTNASGILTANEPLWGGVSKDGQVIVQEMNRIGMLVDLSHVSVDTMKDVLGGRPKKWKGSRAPVMFSHSSAFSVCPHPRNVPDDVLKLVKDTNSVVMVNFAPDFISCTASDSSTGLPDFYPGNATLGQVVRHITHIGDLIGYDHVGIGSDFDGIPSTPKGLGDVSAFPALVGALLEAGISDKDASKIVGENILRVWHATEKVAKDMQKEGVKPAEDDIPKRHFEVQ